MIRTAVTGAMIIASLTGCSNDIHVAVTGDDAHDGSASRPLKTISMAAMRAQPGDVITVHQGVYRERIDPPRGGISDKERIVFRAAPGEEVVIKGSEVVTGWERVHNDAWKVTLPNAFFGDFNPYADTIKGDWFDPLGRDHHTGAVYLNGHWLTEAATLDHVLEPVGSSASSYDPRFTDHLLDITWFRPLYDSARRIPAASFTEQHGIGTGPCVEGGECIGRINQDDWVRYTKVDFGTGTSQVEFRASSGNVLGGSIEIRLQEPDGDLLGTCSIPTTDGWQTWRSFIAGIKKVSGMQTICLVFKAHVEVDDPDIRLWFATVDDTVTSIWAQFKDVDPNEHLVEINVRQSVFYPHRTGINYLTVRGFRMMHAATNWAPPTAEQIGLVGTNWSKGWVIEDNVISHSVCTGITLGKHGDAYDNTSANSAEGYVKTIERALARGWSGENIGHHIVRNNRISHCEQAGIVGSMGAVFSQITGNTIHDIHVRRLFNGAEMAGIKFHGAVDTEISGNHIHHTCLGIWLDWMTQGTRVARNVLHDNGPSHDIFVEVNHGPYLIENNILLSPRSILVNSQGGAYAHNLIAGQVNVLYGEQRETPHLKAHATDVAGLAPNPSGDERHVNNIYLKHGLAEYDRAVLPVLMKGNVFLHGARPSKHETGAVVKTDVDPGIALIEREDGLYLHLVIDGSWTDGERPLVTTQLLGKAHTPQLPYEMPDGSPYVLDRDFLGEGRNAVNPRPGPFEFGREKNQAFKIR